MDFTRFEKLRRAVELLGASQVVARLEKQLVGKGIDVDDPERIITGDNGIYYITPEGVLTRVLIHIVDKQIGDRYGAIIADLVRRRDFDTEELIKNIHRYHLVKCKTIGKAENEGWKTKYKMSRRRAGRFFYRFIDGNRVIESDQQRLLPCMNCLADINQILGRRYTVSNFVPDELLGDEAFIAYGLPRAGELADFSKPNSYSEDWAEISRRYRSLAKYQCQDPSCPAPDLSSIQYKKYLHVHHVSQDKSDNAYTNLRALCIYCHARQPNHASMKQLSVYREYSRLRGLKDS